MWTVCGGVEEIEVDIEVGGRGWKKGCFGNGM